MMILADSSFFIALADRKDQWHAGAKKLMPAIAGETLVISDMILAEAVTIIGRRSGGKAGELLYHYFIDNCEIVFADEQILKRGMAVFLRYDGTLSVSDAVYVAIMEMKKINRIVSFDSDFDKVDGIVRIS
ncbi:MAG: PIN domain-containing protein [Methanoregula sp.]|nr:MAG: PIN domain-containing protein [Methanoregula sp.]